MDIKKGRRKSFDIEFVAVTPENIEEVAAWSGGIIGGEGTHRFIRLQDKAAINSQQQKAFINDVVVKSDETHSYKKFTRKAFNKAFEEIEVEVIHRDAGTGEFVTEADAKADPDGTIEQKVEIPFELPRDAGLG